MLNFPSVNYHSEMSKESHLKQNVSFVNIIYVYVGLGLLPVVE